MQSYHKMDDSMPLKICQTLLIMILLTSYLDNNDAGKAYRNRKSLLDSEHLSNVMTQNIVITLNILLFVVTVFKRSQPAINRMMFGLPIQGYWKHSRR